MEHYGGTHLLVEAAFSDVTQDGWGYEGRVVDGNVAHCSHSLHAHLHPQAPLRDQTPPRLEKLQTHDKEKRGMDGL
jgi:hypothetical protein